MNILIVSHGIPSKADPQWGCFELDQARALSSLGHHVCLTAIDGRFRKSFRHIGFRHTSFGGIDTCVFFLLPLRLIPSFRLRAWARDRMMIRLFQHMIRRHGVPDVIYAHYYFTISQLELVKSHFPNIPIIGIEHAGRIIKKNVFSNSEVFHFNRAFRNADKMLAVSPALQSALMNRFAIKSEVLYDMVGNEFLTGTITKKKHIPFRYVTTGSLVEDKAIDQILRALARVENRSSELYIIGEGPDRSVLSQLALSQGISDRVHFMGMCDKQRMIELYQFCDVFVLVSRLETFCVVNIEAMAMGLPVISTRCGGPENYITDSNGILLDVDDLEGLVTAMNYMEQNIEKYDPEALRVYVRSRFSGEVIAREAERIMKETIEQKRQQNQKYNDN